MYAKVSHGLLLQKRRLRGQIEEKVKTGHEILELADRDINTIQSVLSGKEPREALGGATHLNMASKTSCTEFGGRTAMLGHGQTRRIPR